MAQDINNPADLPEAPIDENTRVVASVGWPTGTGAVVDLDSRFTPTSQLPAPGISDAPSDGTPYNRQDAAWVAATGGDLSNYVKKTGETDAVDLTGSSGVTVPDATADGQAIAYGQFGTELADITVAAAQPQWNFTETDQSADNTRFRIYMAGGNMFLQPIDDAGNPQSTPMRWNRGGQVDASGATWMKVPLPTDTDHALRWGSKAVVAVPDDTASPAAPQPAAVVAFDSVTGRYAVQGPLGVIEQGDTGWRDVSGDLLNEWTATTFLLRRIGNVAYLKVSALDAIAGSGTAWVVPVGYRTVSTTLVTLTTSAGVSAAAAVIQSQFLSNGSFQSTINAAAQHGIASWPVDDAWPASLPGTPV